MPSDSTPTRASEIYWSIRPQERGTRTSFIHPWAGLGGQPQKQKSGAWYQENIKPSRLKKQIPGKHGSATRNLRTGKFRVSGQIDQIFFNSYVCC